MSGVTKNWVNSKLILGLVVLLLGACGGGGGGGSSSGPNDDPDGDGFNNAVDIDDDNDGLIEIATLEELDWMRNSTRGEYLEDHEGNRMMDGCLDIVCVGYELVADLDFDTNGDGLMDANDTYFNGGSGWSPINIEANFEGNGHRISNLYINRSSGSWVGFFGTLSGITSSIYVQNLTIDGDLMSITGSVRTGALVGTVQYNVRVSGVSIAGKVVGTRPNTGGLAGVALVGIDISDCHFSGDVTGTDRTAGLLGDALYGVNITGSSVSGNIMGSEETGGLVGQAYRGINISESFSSGTVSGLASTGGLVGLAEKNYSDDPEADTLIIRDSGSSSDVFGEGIGVGGLVGRGDGDGLDRIDPGGLYIFDSYATGSVTGSDSYVGGLVGLVVQGGGIENSYATGSVNGANFAGGLIGSVNLSDKGTYEDPIDTVTVQSSFATGAVTVDNGSYVGGLIGISYNVNVEDTFVTGAVSNGDRYVAGLIGDANEDSSISRSFSANTVGGVTDVGALVGWSDGATYEDNYFADDINTLNGVGTATGSGNTGQTTDVTGDALSSLQAVTAPGQNGSFTDWDEAVWDFGTSSQLPGLIIGGETYRDGDADGVLD